MPGKNIEKIYVPDTYYHVYNKGVGGINIFCDPQDYQKFVELLQRSLGNESNRKTQKGHKHPSFHGKVKLISYCLTAQDFHLLLKTEDKPKNLPELLRSVLTAYVMYFNKKHVRSGPLFGTRYRAVRITNDHDLEQVSMYIHTKPLQRGHDHFSFKHSSMQQLLDGMHHDWIDVQALLRHNNANLSDYISRIKKHDLSDEAIARLERSLY